MPSSRTGRVGRRLVVVAATLAAGLAAGAVTPASAQIEVPGWHLAVLHIGQAWQVTKGKGVTVAVVDSGVSADHAMLRGRVLPGARIADGSWLPRGKGWRDRRGHGTAVASAIAGNGSGGVFGAAPEAKILPVHVAVDGRRERPIVVSRAVRGIVWAVDHGADVINLSFGSLATEQGGRRMAEAIAYAASKDVVVVASAGNEGTSHVAYPSAFPGVISVGAVGSDKSLTDESNHGKRVAVVAPGKAVYVADGRRIDRSGFADGTSVAAGIVSGVAALVRAQYPDLSAAEVTGRIVRTATDLGKEGRDNRFGFGMVDAGAAVTAQVPKAGENPLGAVDRPWLMKHNPENEPVAYPAKRPVTPISTAGWASAAAGGIAALLGLLLLGSGVRSRWRARRPMPPVPAGAPPVPAGGPPPPSAHPPWPAPGVPPPYPPYPPYPPPPPPAPYSTRPPYPGPPGAPGTPPYGP